MSRFRWDEYRVHEPMEVRYFNEGGRGWPEPEFEESWSELDKLRWHAGVVEARCGVRARIVTGCYSERRFGRDHYPPDLYAVSVGRSQYGVLRYQEAWTYLNGVEAGVDAIRDRG